MVSSGISQGLIDDFKEIREMAEKIAGVIEANGPINIQCRKSENGIYPFEINPRFSGTVGPRVAVGYNEPDIFCRYLLFNEIPEKIIDKVINPFFSTKPDNVGTGLGLSISHGIISEHNGKLSIDSQEGEYTRIIVLLPVADGEEHES